MLRRVVLAPIVAATMAVSASVVVDAQRAALPSGPAVSTVTDSAPQVAAQAPGFECATGLVATLCAIVLGPICHDHCLAAATASPGTGAATADATRAASGVRAAAVGAPNIVCARGFEILCTILGLTVCRNHPCGFDAAPTAMQRVRES